MPKARFQGLELLDPEPALEVVCVYLKKTRMPWLCFPCFALISSAVCWFADCRFDYVFCVLLSCLVRIPSPYHWDAACRRL